MAVIYPGDVCGPQSWRLREGSGALIVHRVRFHMLSPSAGASFCHLVHSGGIPALVSVVCFISFCFEQMGEQRAAQSFPGLCWCQGRDCWFPVAPRV